MGKVNEELEALNSLVTVLVVVFILLVSIADTTSIPCYSQVVRAAD